MLAEAFRGYCREDPNLRPKSQFMREFIRFDEEMMFAMFKSYIVH